MMLEADRDGRLQGGDGVECNVESFAPWQDGRERLVVDSRERRESRWLASNSVMCVGKRERKCGRRDVGEGCGHLGV